MNTEVAQRGLGRNQTIKLRNQSGQYRNAVASGESQNADHCLILPRIGTDRSEMRNEMIYGK